MRKYEITPQLINSLKPFTQIEHLDLHTYLCDLCDEFALYTFNHIVGDSEWSDTFCEYHKDEWLDGQGER